MDYITEDFLELPLDEITRFQVSSKVKEIVAKGTLETATRCLRLLNSVFNFAIASGYTEKNPCILVGELIAVLNKFTELGRPHTRVVT